MSRIKGSFVGKDIISLDQFTPDDIKILFDLVKRMKKVRIDSFSKILSRKIVSLLFFEPSSRTFFSFSAAAKKLGGQTLEVQNVQTSLSVAKGETFDDTIRVFEAYSDCIIIRHPEKGAAFLAAGISSIPIINAGDGIGEHPTQTLLDLYTIYEKLGKLNGLTGVIAGDMLNGRTVHSLIRGLSLYPKNTLYLLSPNELKLSKDDYHHFLNKGIKLIEITSYENIPLNANFWYWTRIQKERFKNLNDYYKVKNKFIISNELLRKKGNKNMIIMHPLPRVGEIELAIDQDPRAVYLNLQIQNGLFVRMAILSLVLGKS